MFQNNLNYLINKDMLDKKITKAKVCENIGITKQNLNMYQNGSIPIATKFYLIAKYFNITMEDLLNKDLENEEL